jgi:hypothetical protein
MMRKKPASKKASVIKTRPAKKMALAEAKAKPRCGLCGAAKNLTKTECCGNWVCDDEASYVAFSYAHNSCYRNHRRYTLCGYHCSEEHIGKWQDCQECRSAFETEMYVFYGTNEFNFEVLENPPDYEPTKCAGCGVRIVLGDGGYMMSGDDYWCSKCSPIKM